MTVRRLMDHEEREHPAVRRWPAALAALGIGVGYAFAPDYMRLGPRWMLLAALAVALVPLNVVRKTGHFLLTRQLALVITGACTAVIVSSALFLIVRLPGGVVTAIDLLRDGGVIWVLNVLVFALWYWEIDCDGPHIRHVGGYRPRDLLFPQATLPESERNGWAPAFMDYLFLAFNTSTAFSPTDTLVLSRRVKGLMMLQSLISVVVIGVLIARAINTLGS